MAVEFGSFDTGVVDSPSAIVVTSRMRTVVWEKTSSSAVFSAIHTVSPGARAWPIAVTPRTTAARYRYCGIVGASSSSACNSAAASMAASRSGGTRAHLLNLSAKSRDMSSNGSQTM